MDGPLTTRSALIAWQQPSRLAVLDTESTVKTHVARLPQSGLAS
jgi:hypothetical protein